MLFTNLGAHLFPRMTHAMNMSVNVEEKWIADKINKQKSNFNYEVGLWMISILFRETIHHDLYRNNQ
jgi:hypothetical protein